MDCFDFSKDFTIAYFYHTYFVTCIKGIIEQAANATAEVTHLPLERQKKIKIAISGHSMIFVQGLRSLFILFFRFLPEGSDIPNPGV